MNKGTGAGGKNTTSNGKSYEQKTSIEQKLISEGFLKKDFYYEFEINNKKIIYTLQNNFNKFMKQQFNFTAIRKPDEVFIIIEPNKKTIIKVLEKKCQNCEGSVETKLWAGPSLLREYQLYYSEDFIIEYAFSVNDYLENKIKSNNIKWNLLNQILLEQNIKIFFGFAENYYCQIFNWIMN
jgi:hypothetical protein